MLTMAIARTHSRANWGRTRVGYLPANLRLHDPAEDDWRLRLGSPQIALEAFANAARFRIVGTFGGAFGTVTVDEPFFNHATTSRFVDDPGSDTEPEAAGEPYQNGVQTFFFKRWEQVHPSAPFAGDTALPSISLLISNQIREDGFANFFYEQAERAWWMDFSADIVSGTALDGDGGSPKGGGHAQAGAVGESDTASALVLTFLGVPVELRNEDSAGADPAMTGSLAIEVDGRWGVDP